MLFDSDPRISRTEIAPFGRSSTGRGMPDISFGSGIANPPCALAPLAMARTQPRTQSKEQTTRREEEPTQKASPSRRKINTPLRPLYFCGLCCPLCPCRESLSRERLSATLAESRVMIVGRLARRTHTLGEGGRATLRAWFGARRPEPSVRIWSQPLRKILLDLIAIPCPRVELLDQRRRARAQPARHIVKIRLRQPPHRPVELELLDRSQCEQLLALERDTRA